MNKTNPRLLYVAYFFPPAPAIACVRTWNTVKYLTKLGWSVTVVTPHPSLWLKPEELPSVESEIKEIGVQRILTGHKFPMLMPDYIKWIPGRLGWFLGGIFRIIARRVFKVEAQIGWVSSVKSATANLKPGDFDLVLATTGPNVSARLAKWLSNRLQCPFVLDYRDPWTGNPHTNISITNEEEASLVKECSAMTVVSNSWAKLIANTFDVRNKVHVISNGFTPNMFTDISPLKYDHFSVVYAGVLYPPKRVLDPILKAFTVFVSSGNRIPAKFHYFGPHGDAVQDAARFAGCEEYMVVHGQVSRKEALAAQKGAGLTVVVSSVLETGTISDNGMITAKVFDCMAMRCPAIVVAPNGSDLYEIVSEVGGMRCFTGKDIKGMSAYISTVANGERPEYLNPDVYQWNTLAKTLNIVLSSVIN